MNTQVSFTTETSLKNKALEKAKAEGITLKALLVYAMKSFIEGKIRFDLVAPAAEPDVEELFFTDKQLQAKAARLAKLLK